jgi:hypothetical protein
MTIQDQVDDLLAYNNANFPLRPIQWRWDNPDVGYDGDPNDSAAPPILGLTPAGSTYLESNGTRWLKQVSGLWVNHVPWSADLEIYVDPAGDDDNPGSATNPIASIAEAITRVAAGGRTTIFLSAGVHNLPNQGWTRDRTVLSGENVSVDGHINVLESFTVASMATNVITAQGSPGWTINEHVGKQLRWEYFGPAWPDWYYGWWILSNTADTLTVAMTTTLLGGFISPPGAGTSLDIVELDSVITPTNGNDPYSRFHYEGGVTFRDIHFDGTLATTGTTSWTGGAEAMFRFCKITDYTGGFGGIVDFGRIYVLGCHFKDCDVAVSVTQFGQLYFDNFFEDCAVAIDALNKCFIHLSSQSYVWAKNCPVVIALDQGATVYDQSQGVWLDNVGKYGVLATGSNYIKSVIGLSGFDATKRDANTYVYEVTGPNCTMSMRDSSQITVGPDADFFRVDGVSYSLATYIADGANAEFPNNTRVIE